ncbi:hypothetical protein [uncultured Methanofollis sp.]|uniref:hypothetical protein n=1 Tax=uncultured Methanofollis sp. TaxID=262500 RepID=UPI002620C794|nr:hypothetical protein [uncultured Methanofollis sp.]
MSQEKLAIIECVPQNEDKKEGLVLYEFLHTTGIDFADYFEFTNCSDLLEFLASGEVEEYASVHLSGHGAASGDEACFKMPRGRIHPDEFPAECFLGKTVAVSACELGRKCFADPFLATTMAAAMIAPQREVPFIDAAVFFVNYYYHLYRQGVRPRTAFDRTREYLNGKALGGFQYFS